MSAFTRRGSCHWLWVSLHLCQTLRSINLMDLVYSNSRCVFRSAHLDSTYPLCPLSDVAFWNFTDYWAGGLRKEAHVISNYRYHCRQPASLASHVLSPRLWRSRRRCSRRRLSWWRHRGGAIVGPMSRGAGEQPLVLPPLASGAARITTAAIRQCRSRDHPIPPCNRAALRRGQGGLRCKRSVLTRWWSSARRAN